MADDEHNGFETCTASAAPEDPHRNLKGSRLEFHELANILPMPNAEKLGELAQDIRDHGLRDPIILHEGKILDGRSRYLACQQAGVEPTFAQFTGGDALALVVSRNLHRRQMNGSQRAMVAAKIANFPIGGNQHSAGLPIGTASKLLNVSGRSVARAKQVLDSGDADLIKAVEAGDVAVSTAAASITGLTKATAHKREAELAFGDGKAVEALHVAEQAMQLAMNEAAGLRDELHRQRIIASNAYADACAADPDFDRHDCSIQSSARALLVKALVGLASTDPVARAEAGHVAERIRSKLNLTWNQLLARESDDDLGADDVDNADDGLVFDA